VYGFSSELSKGEHCPEAPLRSAQSRIPLTATVAEVAVGVRQSVINVGQTLRYLRAASPFVGICRHLAVPIRSAVMAFLYVGPTLGASPYRHRLELVVKGCAQCRYECPKKFTPSRPSVLPPRCDYMGMPSITNGCGSSESAAPGDSVIGGFRWSPERFVRACVGDPGLTRRPIGDVGGDGQGQNLVIVRGLPAITKRVPTPLPDRHSIGGQLIDQRLGGWECRGDLEPFRLEGHLAGGDEVALRYRPASIHARRRGPPGDGDAHQRGVEWPESSAEGSPCRSNGWDHFRRSSSFTEYMAWSAFRSASEPCSLWSAICIPTLAETSTRSPWIR
jgi:hypothetical protein